MDLECLYRLRERHRIRRIGWLRAAVLGANDGIRSLRAWCPESPQRMGITTAFYAYIVNQLQGNPGRMLGIVHENDDTIEKRIAVPGVQNVQWATKTGQ